MKERRKDEGKQEEILISFSWDFWNSRWSCLNEPFWITSFLVMSCPKQNKTKRNIETIHLNAGKDGLCAKLSLWWEGITSYAVISGRSSSQHEIWTIPNNFRFDSRLIILLKLEHWETIWYYCTNNTCKIPGLPWETVFSGFTMSCSENNKRKIFSDI